MKKAPTLQCTFLHQYIYIYIIPPTTPITHSIARWNDLKNQCWRRNVHRPFVSFFGLVPTLLKIISYLTSHFLLHLGIQPSKTVEELLHYHLYHKEGPFYMDVHPHLFNIPFIIFLILSLQYNIMIQHILFCHFIQP